MSAAKKQAFGFSELQAQIKAGQAGGVYLFEGEEENLKQSARNLLRKAILPEGMEELNETVLEAPAAGAVIEACETLPFLAEKRLIFVRDQAGLSSRAEPEDALLDYLPALPPTAVLVFYHIGAANGTRKLYKAIERCGQVVRFARMNEAALTDWVTRAFAKLGSTCPPAAARELLFTCGTDTGLLRTEIEKLAAYVPPEREISAEDIRTVATPSIECRIFDLVDAVVEGKDARAFRLLRDLKLGGSDDPYILAMLLRQFRLMRQVKIMLFEKQPPAEMQRLLGMPPFAYDRLLRQTRGWNGGQVRRGFETCLSAEADFKSGRVPAEGLAETVLLRLSAIRQGIACE